jgi:hypothetical protein
MLEPWMSVGPALRAIAAIALAAALTACSGAAAADDVSAAETKLVEQTLLEGHLKLLVPDHFTALDETAIHARFHLDYATVVALQNGDGSIEVVAILQKSAAGPSKVSADTAADRQVRLLGDALRRSYAARKSVRDEVVIRDGRPIYFFEVAGALRERNRRVVCAYTLLGDQPLEVVYTCPEQKAAEWAPIGERIVDSVVVKE